jgi:hypothetical protein
MLSPEFHAAFKPALENSKKLPAAEAFETCLGIIEEYPGLCYTVTATADQFLVHEKNRSNLMLNGGKAHKVGEQIHHAGADPKQLDATFAFELAKESDRRDAQLKKNQELIDRSSNLVAPINGKERFLTIGTSHFTQFVKQALRGGKTNSKKLQDRLGNIDTQALKRNKNMSKLMELGWPWKIFAAELDAAYPEFATLAQRALNAFNSIRQETGEIETACQVADFYSSAIQEGAVEPKAQAIQAVSDGGSTIQSYVEVIFEYALEYGGGEQLPWLRFVDELSRSMSSSKPLGSSFWHSMYALKFWADPKVKAKPARPLIRLALLCVQSCMSSAKDGVASFLTDSDLRKVSSKASSKDVADIDDVLSEAFKLAEVIDPAYLTKFLEPIGLLMIRCGLKLVDKEKHALEGKQRKIDELKSIFLSELSAAHGGTVTYEPWNASPASGVSAPAESSVLAPAAPSVKVDFKSFQDFDTIQGQAKKHGFTIGDFVYEKEFESKAENWFTILELHSPERITLQKVFSYSGAPLERINLSLEVLISRWAIRKEPKVPYVMANAQIRTSAAIAIEQAKCNAFEQLLKLDKAKCKANQHIEIWADPVQVRSTSRAIAAEQLTLVPFVPTLANISSKQTPTSMQIQSEPNLYLVPPAKPQVKEGHAQLDEDQNCIAFWLVGETHVQDDANMVETIISGKGDVSFKCLINPEVIEPHTQLLVYKPAAIKEAKRPLRGATIIPPVKKNRISVKQPAA